MNLNINYIYDYINIIQNHNIQELPIENILHMRTIPLFFEISRHENISKVFLIQPDERIIFSPSI